MKKKEAAPDISEETNEAAAETPVLNEQTDDELLSDGPAVQAVDDVHADGENASADDATVGSELDESQQELQEARDRALRSQAELDNFRKRARREMEEERRYACLPLMRDLLPVIDNLQRAVSASQPDESAQGLLEGVQMVAQQLTSVLEQHHCRLIEAAGLPFDPMCHEAVAQQPSDEHPQGTVLEIAQTGYRLHDRVIRPTQVVVSKNTPDQTTAGSC